MPQLSVGGTQENKDMRYFAQPGQCSLYGSSVIIYLMWFSLLSEVILD